jgi:HEPN domain-containing protein
MSDPELLREVARWIRYSEDDLIVAELIQDHDQVPRAACFNAQQCAEKSLKASLVFLQIAFPKTHDLNRLRDLLPEGWTVKEDFPDLAELSTWAVEPRYPGDIIEATRQDADTAVEQARDIHATTLEDLNRHGYTPDDEEPQDEHARRENG